MGPLQVCRTHFTEMCSGFEAGSYLRLIDFVHRSTLGLRVIHKKKKATMGALEVCRTRLWRAN